MLLFNVLFFLIFTSFYNTIASASELKLQLLQVIFRHGDRLANEEEIYRDDPNDDYFKEMGYGDLTKKGERLEKDLGKNLRTFYNDFLGEINKGDIVAFSTNYDRTKTSLYNALVGLSTGSAFTDSDPKGCDFLSVFTCTRYSNEWNYTRHTRDFILEKFSSPKYNSLLKLLDENASMDKRNHAEYSLWNAFLVYSNLRAAKSAGKDLPKWLTEENYQLLEKMSSITYDSMVFNDRLKRMMVGPMIEKLLKNIHPVNDKEGKDKRANKIYMYAAHDFNIATFVRAHNLKSLKGPKIPLVPDYGSALIVEHLKDGNNKSFIQMKLWTGYREELLDLSMEGCEFECPLERYENLIDKMLPRSNEDKWCVSDECRSESEQKKRSQPGKPTIYLRDNDAKMAFAIAGYGVLSFKYGRKLFTTGPH